MIFNDPWKPCNLTQLPLDRHYSPVSDCTPFLYSSQGKTVEQPFINCTRFFLTDGSPKEQQSAAGFCGRRAAAVPVRLA